MALPGNLGTGTVTGTILDEDGNPVSGSVTFNPRPDYLVNAGADRIIGLGSTTVPLVEGAFSATLIATDDADCTPVDWTYTVSFKVAGIPAIGSFDISVPESSTTDLADITPSISSSGQAIVRGAGVPAGGTTGQVLSKASDADDDTEWTSVEGITPPTLGELSDTNVGSVTDGQTIVWDDDNSEWIPGSAAAGSVAWDDVTGKPTEFTPADHTHNVADVSGLQDTLDDLQAQITALSNALDLKLDKKAGVTMRAAGYGPTLPTTDNQDGDFFYVPEAD